MRLRAWHTLCPAGGSVEYAYFPTSCIIGLSAPSAAHATVQVALVGSEGLCASPLMSGLPLSPLGAVVLTDGWALRLHFQRFRSELADNPGLRFHVNRYLHVLIAQTAELVTCTRHHPVEARLARWLLMMRDRSQTDIILMKHETLAQMLGVQRTGVTLAAVNLKRNKVIRYARGRIEILDHAGLEAAACPCYAWANDLYDRLIEPNPSVQITLF